jgi:Inositol-pentakisphosphate 2-kinase
LLAEQITEHLLSSSLIPTLLAAQISPASSLATKMTLRDCTLFVQVPKELIPDLPSHLSDDTSSTTAQDDPICKNHRKIRIVITDLDEKSQIHRGEYWKSVEDNLIKGEYYLGRGKTENDEHNADDCDLSDDGRTLGKLKWGQGCGVN